MSFRNPFPSKIKAIFFDAGGTLLYPYPSVGSVYAKVAQKYGCRVSERWVQKRFDRLWPRLNIPSLRRYSSEEDERFWWRNLVEVLFGPKMPKDRFARFFNELYLEFGQTRCWRLYPETRRALRQLKEKGLILGIVSNWDSRLFTLSDGFGLSRYVDFVLASAVLGTAKPHPAIVQKALSLAEVLPSQALHVGDSQREDIEGARRAGIRSLQIRRAHKDKMEREDFIRNLLEIPRRILKIWG